MADNWGHLTRTSEMVALGLEVIRLVSTHHIYIDTITICGNRDAKRDGIQLGSICSNSYSCKDGSQVEIWEVHVFAVFQLCIFRHCVYIELSTIDNGEKHILAGVSMIWMEFIRTDY